jgi:hypothetical protein
MVAVSRLPKFTEMHLPTGLGALPFIFPRKFSLGRPGFDCVLEHDLEGRAAILDAYGCLRWGTWKHLN